MENKVKVGILGKTHGVKGHLYLHLSVSLRENGSPTDVVYTSSDGTWIPHFIKHWEAISDEKLIIGFEDYTSKESAANLSSTNVYCDQNSFESCFQKISLPGEQFIGFQLFDLAHGNIGVIDEVLDLNSNLLLKITHPTGELLIPFTDAYLIEIDEEQKSIKMDLPDGLLELNRKHAD